MTSDQQTPTVATLRTSTVASLVALAFTLGACSGGSSSVNGPQGPSTQNQFSVDTVNVLDGEEWKLNRPIEVTFNKDVDFSTVSLSTIQIVDNQGVPAIGTFSEVNSRQVRFQPVCPSNDDNSNGGLLQGREYRLTIPAQSTPGIGGGVTVSSTAGERLSSGVNVSFDTPMTSDLNRLFIDVQPGPPQIRVRRPGTDSANSLDASYVEFTGRDDDADGMADREFLLFDLLAQEAGIVSTVPLNLYSRTEEQFSFILRFNQPVAADSSNINSQRVGIEYEAPRDSGNWESISSSVSLVANCTAVGATIRLKPEGIVPQDSPIRAVIREGFSDLTGDSVPAALTNFAVVETTVASPGQVNPDDGSDEVLEPFIFGGTGVGSREDVDVSSSSPRALWATESNPGVVQASFAFGGTGGPNGTFDWRISNEVILNTDNDTIQGGPDFFPSVVQPVIGGVINVRNMEILPTGRLTIIGSNTCTILATGTVEINGPISANGADNRGVGNLNTANIPEPGASGNGGGGDGGVGSFLTTQSTPRGGVGEGAFGVPGTGGGGGETGVYPANAPCAIENRRGGGGGGGRFGPDIRYRWTSGNVVRCQTLIGMDIERGSVGSFDSIGAVSQNLPPQGGLPGPSPFLDPDPENNFYGVITLSDGRQVRGELPSVWAGAGGGAGGDAVRSATFPLTPFTVFGDEKGSGGGGGAGGIQILSIGNITIDTFGSISADGGHGGGGENQLFFDRIGGGSGGGSGGHIVLSSAGSIIVRAEATGPTVGVLYLDDPTVQAAHIKRPLRALGGQGGCGRGPGNSVADGQGRCGGNENGETRWNKDNIPTENFDGDLTVPPRNMANAVTWGVFCSQTDGCSTNFPIGETPGAGGDGSPGLIQLHVENPATQLVFEGAGAGTYGDDLMPADPTFSMTPPPFGWKIPDAMGNNVQPDLMVPFFSATSESFSEWIALGLARVNPGNPAPPAEQVQFLFEGTDPLTGEVIRDGLNQQELAPLVPHTALSLGGALPAVDGPSATFTFAGGAAIDPTGIYAQNPALMRQFAVRVRTTAAPVVTEEFIVQSATYDEADDEFSVVVDPRGALGTILQAPGIEVEMVPFYFRLRSAGVQDLYPAGTTVRILFDATTLDPATGEPSVDPAEILSGGNTDNFTPDITDLNAQTYDFFRFKVQFEIDVNDLGSARPALDFLRLPFRF